LRPAIIEKDYYVTEALRIFILECEEILSVSNSNSRGGWGLK